MRTSLAGGLPKIQQPVVASESPPLCNQDPIQAPPELQDRRDYTPADRAAGACWLGCPGLLYHLAARDVKLSFSLVPLYMAASSKIPPH
ncbi:hypothetical protein TNCV_2673621 [Trichonephila clavipes]|nr:hypothetical protein TNCV_2673621 [Trichonephila clavipes]